NWQRPHHARLRVQPGGLGGVGLRRRSGSLEPDRGRAGIRHSARRQQATIRRTTVLKPVAPIPAETFGSASPPFCARSSSRKRSAAFHAKQDYCFSSKAVVRQPGGVPVSKKTLQRLWRVRDLPWLRLGGRLPFGYTARADPLRCESVALAIVLLADH